MGVVLAFSLPLPHRRSGTMKVNKIDFEKLMDCNKEQHAYMAGFFDGEGHISIARRGAVHTSRNKSTPMRSVWGLVAGIAQNKKAPLVLFYDIFAGTLRIDTRVRVGRFGKQVIYEWTLGGNTAVPVLLKWLRPYLLVKRGQVDIALEFVDAGPNDMTEEVFLEFQQRMRNARSNEAEAEYMIRNGTDG